MPGGFSEFWESLRSSLTRKKRPDFKPAPWMRIKNSSHVDLSNEPGHAIPAGFWAGGNLTICNRPRLREIGDWLDVGGNLIIGGDARRASLTAEQKRVPIRRLPEHLRVGGSLELRNCFLLESIPANARVGSSIIIQDCDSLRSLPDPWEVKGSLTIIGGKALAALPKSLHVRGDFRLSGTRVTALPEQMYVGGSLVVEGRSRLQTVPATIRVGGDMVFRHCPIECLPMGLQVRRHLRITGARKLKHLPAELTVPGMLDLTDCTALEDLPDDLVVGESLKLKRCRSLRALPDGLEVPQTLDLRGCTSLCQLPRMNIGGQLQEVKLDHGTNAQRRVFTPALRLADCPNITSLPGNLVLGGAIDVAGSGLTDVPTQLKDVQILWRGVLISPDVAFHPERVAPLDVLTEPNAELRRVMMERTGAELLLEKVKAETRDADSDAGGLRRLVYVRRLDRCCLFCRCPSTSRAYLLRVPPATRTCQQAAAWIAGFDDANQYRPVVET